MPKELDYPLLHAKLSDLELQGKINLQRCFNKSVELGICTVDKKPKIVPDSWKLKLAILEQERDKRVEKAMQTLQILMD